MSLFHIRIRPEIALRSVFLLDGGSARIDAAYDQSQPDSWVQRSCSNSKVMCQDKENGAAQPGLEEDKTEKWYVTPTPKSKEENGRGVVQICLELSLVHNALPKQQANYLAQFDSLGRSQ